MTADANYIKQMKVTMFSILFNAKDTFNVHFHVFCNGYKKSDYEDIENFVKHFNAKVLFYDMEKYLYLFDKADVNTFTNKYINISCYFRLLLLKILPENVTKCFYIDCDMIVNTDLSSVLEETEIYDFATVMECIAMHFRDTTLRHLYDIEEFKKFTKEPYKYSYFNAGFFLIDLNWVRRENIWEKTINFFEKYPTLPFADQDILNYVISQKYQEHIYFLGPEYNVFAGFSIKMKDLTNEKYTSEEVKKAYKDPKIVHYAGPWKPWNVRPCKFYFMWWKYYRKMKKVQSIYKCQ